MQKYLLECYEFHFALNSILNRIKHIFLTIVNFSAQKDFLIDYFSAND